MPTNVREFDGTRYNGNSIFVFDIADLCIAHLGHLHHTLTPSHLAELGAIDVVMVPVDGVWTLNQDDMIEVLRQIKPKIVIPMHIFTQRHLGQISDKDRRFVCGCGRRASAQSFSPGRSCRKERRYWSFRADSLTGRAELRAVGGHS